MYVQEVVSTPWYDFSILNILMIELFYPLLTRRNTPTLNVTKPETKRRLITSRRFLIQLGPSQRGAERHLPRIPAFLAFVPFYQCRKERIPHLSEVSFYRSDCAKIKIYYIESLLYWKVTDWLFDLSEYVSRLCYNVH